jgi:hypothetical protein
VGIEHYKDPVLDELQYAADDARNLKNELSAVTALDPNSVMLLADDDEKTFVTDSEIRTEFQKFVQNIKDGMSVVVYLGGHGTKSGLGGLRFLPSNFDRTAQTGDLDFDEFRTRIQAVVAAKSLTNVTVTFLVNTCASGNALMKPGGMSLPDNQAVVDDLREVFKGYKFGRGSYALIPATARDRDTYEEASRHASVYAYYLNEGLAGLAATKDGVVTAGSLYDYLCKKLDQSLPWNPELDRDIVLAVTRKLEGEGQFMLGSALVVAAQVIGSGKPGSEFESHQRALLELAAESFDRVASRAPGLGARAMLRHAQIEALSGRRLSNDLRPAVINTDPLDAQDLKLLYDPDDGASAKVALPALRNELAAGAPFYALILEGIPTNAPTPSFATNAVVSAAAVAWRKTLEGFPGHQAVESRAVQAPSIPRDRAAGIPEALKMVDKWITAAVAATTLPRLVIVYSGTARRRQDGSLYPFGVKEVAMFAGNWPGPVIIVYLGPYGGRFLKAEPPRKDMSLLLASEGEEGMAATGIGVPLAAAFAEGVADLGSYAPLLDLYKRTRARYPDSLLGTASWVPIWGAPTSRSTAEKQVEPFKRFAFQLAAGCALAPLAECDAKTLAELGRDPFDMLVKAANADVNGDFADAAANYTSTATVLHAAAKKASLLPADKALQQLLDDAAAPIKMRAAIGRAQSRRVVILRAAVSDYKSPLIADLPDPKEDLDAYTGAFRTLLKGNPDPEVVDLVPGTAAELTTALETQKARLSRDDLLIFIYSGRGFESGGRRYVTTGGTAVCNDEPSTSSCVNKWSEVVDLWTIAKSLEGRWLVAIYDTQFSPPRLDPERVDVVLEKNLNSVRPLPALPESAERSTERTDFVLLSRNALPAHQVHIWADGSVTASGNLAAECSAASEQAVSPLAAVLAAVLRTARRDSYAGWVEAASHAPCLSSGVITRIVAQGNLDVPTLATGDAADLVQFFRTGEAQRSVNLRAAEIVARRVEHQFPTLENEIARAALSLAVTMFYDYSSAQLPTADRRRLVDDAVQTLSRAELPPESPSAARRMELLGRAHVIAGNPAQARAELSAEPSLLTKRDLANKLVTLTEEVLRLQPLKLMKETNATLANAGADTEMNESIASAKRRLRDMIEEERDREDSNYYIEPPS